MSANFSDTDFESLFTSVPVDFPRTSNGYALGGLQTKLALVEYGDKFYEPGTSPPEVYERWDMCEDLAKQLAVRCKDVEQNKYAHLSQVEILDQYLTRLVATKWGAAEEMKWVIRRTASLLSWPAPVSATPL